MTYIIDGVDVTVHVNRIASEAPALSVAQRDRLALIMSGTDLPAQSVESEAARKVREGREAREQKRAEDGARVKRIERAVTACRGCGVPRAGHGTNDLWHVYEPLTAEEIPAAVQKELK